MLNDVKKFDFMGKEYEVISCKCIRPASHVSHPLYRLLVHEIGTDNYGTMTIKEAKKNIIGSMIGEYLLSKMKSNKNED